MGSFYLGLVIISYNVVCTQYNYFIIFYLIVLIIRSIKIYRVGKTGIGIFQNLLIDSIWYKEIENSSFICFVFINFFVATQWENYYLFRSACIF